MSEACRVHTLVASAALFADGRVALVKFRNPEQWDGESGWFLPNDGLAFLEHPQAGAKRVLSEQLGIESATPLKLAHFESFKGNNGNWHLGWHYRLELPQVPNLKPGPAVAESRWFSLDDLPSRSEVAHHGWALQILGAMEKVGASRP